MMSARPRHRRQREAAADDLSQCAEIGRHAVKRLRAAIGQAEAGHDLVEDQRDAVFRRRRAHRLQEAGPGRDQPLERLHDDAAEFVVMRLDQRHHGVDVVERRHQHVIGDMRRDAGGIGDRPREIRLPLRRERHQPMVAHPVIAALELQDFVAPAKRAGQPHRIHVGLGAGAHEPHLLGARQRIDDRLGQQDAGRIVGEECGAAGHLLQHRRRHRRMGVADEHRAGAQQVIDVIVALAVAHMPARTLDDHRPRHVAEMAGGQHAIGGVDQAIHGRHPLRLCAAARDRLSGIPAPGCRRPGVPACSPPAHWRTSSRETRGRCPRRRGCR